MARRLYGIAALPIALVELLLCFVGPLAFLRTPSLLLFPLLSSGVEADDLGRLTELLERTIASTGSYSVVSRRFLADWFARNDPGQSRSMLEPVDYLTALRISRELGLERFAIAVAFASESGVELSVSIRETREGESLRSGRFSSDTMESLLELRDAKGEPIPLAQALRIDTKGMGLTDWLVLLLLALQLAAGLAALLRSEGKLGLLIDAVFVPALILFLFAYIHALSANMDYVQRFIASGGELRLARSTLLEQLHAVIRFGPLLLLGAAAYVGERLGAGGKGTRPRGASELAARWALPAVLLSAAMYSLSFPSFLALDGMGSLAWLSLTPLFLVIRGSSPGRGIFYGTAFGALQALVVNYWHGTYSFVTLHLITVVLVAEELLFMLVLVPLLRRSGRWGFLVAPAAWTGFEYLRSAGLLGYPWGIIGVSQYRLIPLIQIASVTGVWGVGFLVALSSSAVAFTLDARGRGRLLPLGCFAGALALALASGFALLARADRERAEAGAAARIVLVQQNTDPRKHAYEENLERLFRLTEAAVAGSGSAPDLVVWPEGGFPLDIRYSRRPDMAHTSWADLTDRFLAFQAGMGSWLLTGTQDHTFIPGDDGNEVLRNFNSSVLIDPDGEVRAFYHKRHLVPFTEHFPLDKKRFAGLYALFQKFDISDWEPGAEPVIFDRDGLRFFTPICFEDLFPDEVRRLVLLGADIIVNLSNDYWSLSPVEGRQHGLHALFRAVENRRPLLRATVSGYTLAVDTAGRILPGAPAPYTEATLPVDVPITPRRLTPYGRLGDWFPLVCLIACGAAAGAALARRLTRRGDRASSAVP